MVLKANAKFDYLYSPLDAPDHVFIGRSEDKDARETRFSDTPVLAARWLEDEHGTIQGIYQKMEYDPKREEVYVQEQSEMKDGVRHGATIQYRPDGRILDIIPFREGREEGIAVHFWRDGSKTYTLYKEGKAVKNHEELIKEWAEKKAAFKFEQEVKSGKIKGLKSLEDAVKASAPSKKGNVR